MRNNLKTASKYKAKPQNKTKHKTLYDFTLGQLNLSLWCASGLSWWSNEQPGLKTKGTQGLQASMWWESQLAIIWGPQLMVIVRTVLTRNWHSLQPTVVFCRVVLYSFWAQSHFSAKWGFVCKPVGDYSINHLPKLLDEGAENKILIVYIIGQGNSLIVHHWT